MRGAYYIELHQNPTIQIKWFTPLLKTADAKKTNCWYSGSISGGSLYPMSVAASARIGENNSLTLILQWEEMGEQYRQEIEIIRQPSGLVQGANLYYFLCPYGYKSFKLFYINGEWRSRRSFKAYYAQQMKSKRDRALEYFSQAKPYEIHGKLHYRGKPTPYAKRLQRYDQRQDKAEEALNKYIFRTATKANKFLK